MTLTMAIGFAAVVDNLIISGESHSPAQKYEGVYIMSVDQVSSSGADGAALNYLRPTNLITTVRAARSGASITYKVTVHNNTDITYWYIRQDYVSDYESNSLIGKSGGITITTADKEGEVGTFNNEDWIPPQTIRDFYVTYTFGANAQGYNTNLVNFVFGMRMDAVHDEFLAVLNDNITDRGYDYLADYFDEQYKKDGSLSINSVDDAAFFAELFGSDLEHVNVDGTEKKATVVIRRENVDKKNTGDAYSGGGPSGCEYTVYITVEDPKSAGKIKVYAISYTKGTLSGVSEWYQLGQLYEGTATTNPDGTFNYSSWLASPATYVIADGITYMVGQPNGDQYDIMKKLEDLMSTQDQDIFNYINNTKFLKKAYDIIAANKNSTDPAVLGLVKAFNDAAPFYNIYNNGQQIDIKRDFTRAEIIPPMEAIQEALDYYYQTTEK